MSKRGIIFIFVMALVSAGFVNANTIIVDKNNPGCSSSGPIFCKIQDGINNAVSYDIIEIRGGFYEEQLSIRKDNIVLQAYLEEKVILDGGIKVNNNTWVLQSGYIYHPGGLNLGYSTDKYVYKQTLSEQAGVMTILSDGIYKKIPNLLRNQYIDEYKNCSKTGWEGPGMIENRQWYSQITSSNPNLQPSLDPQIKFNVWDISNGVFYSLPSGEIFIRFGDNHSPALETIRVAQPKSKCIIIDNVSGITIKDIEINTCEHAVYINGSRASSITLDGITVRNGGKKIVLENAGENIEIKNSLITEEMLTNYHGGSYTGGYECDLLYNSSDCLTKNEIAIKEGFRYMYKWIWTDISGNYCDSHDQSLAVGVFSTGSGFKVHDNVFSKNAAAFFIVDTNNITFTNNTFKYHTSSAFLPASWCYNIVVDGNRFYDNDVVYRPGQTGSLIFRNNKIWNPGGAGDVFWLYYNGPIFDPLQFTIVHNSISGGNNFIYEGGGWDSQPFEKSIISNNIISSKYHFQGANIDRFWNDVFGPTGTFTNNWIGGSLSLFPFMKYSGLQNHWSCSILDDKTNPDSDGQNCFDEANYMWGNPKYAPPSFKIPEGSVAIVGGVDLSNQFERNTRNNGLQSFGPISGYQNNYWGQYGSPDIGAVQSGNITDNLADVNEDGSVNIKDIRICMNVIIGVENNQTLIDKCKIIVDDNIADLNDVKEIVNVIQLNINL